MCFYPGSALITEQICARLLSGKYELSRISCPSYNLFLIKSRAGNAVCCLRYVTVFCRTSSALDFSATLLGLKTNTVFSISSLWSNIKCQKATVAKAIEKQKNLKRKPGTFWQLPTRPLIQHGSNLLLKKEDSMKITPIFAILSVVISTAAQAEKFNLNKVEDSYISLNECLYALTKGTRLAKGEGDVFVYQRGVWEFSFSADQKFNCKLIGELAE